MAVADAAAYHESINRHGKDKGDYQRGNQAYPKQRTAKRGGNRTRHQQNKAVIYRLHRCYRSRISSQCCPESLFAILHLLIYRPESQAVAEEKSQDNRYQDAWEIRPFQAGTYHHSQDFADTAPQQAMQCVGYGLFS